jgi:hypothetical protein
VGPQVAVRDGLHIWGVATIILNKRSWIANKKWSSSLGLSRNLTISHNKKEHITKCYTRPGRLDSSGSGQGSMETLGPINAGKFLHQLSDRKLFKKASASLVFSKINN